MVRLIPSLLAMATVLGGVIGCSAHQPPTPASGCRQLDAFLKWHHGVREFLQSAIDANSRCTGTADGSARKVAIFDWDNTVVKNDIGYATNYYMLQHSLVLQPANQDWHAASRYLTDAAANALSVACGKVVPAGKPLPTGSNALCANEILSLLDGETTTGQPAFVGNNVRRLAGPYAWSNALSAGYTAEELAGFADQAKKQNLAADVGATQQVGTQQVDGYIRVYPQMKDLIGSAGTRYRHLGGVSVTRTDRQGVGGRGRSRRSACRRSPQRRRPVRETHRSPRRLRRRPRRRRFSHDLP